MNLSSISPKYQVTIPKEVRIKFPELKPFKMVNIYERNGEIIISPRKSIDDVIGIMDKPRISGKGKDFSYIRDQALKKTRKL